MIINTYFGSSVVYILLSLCHFISLCRCQAGLNSRETIDRVYYFHLLIRFCSATVSSMFHLLAYQLICVCVCVLFSASGLGFVLSSVLGMHSPAQGPRLQWCLAEATELRGFSSFSKGFWVRGKWGWFGMWQEQELHCQAPQVRRTEMEGSLNYLWVNTSGFHLSFCLPSFCRCCQSMI